MKSLKMNKIFVLIFTFIYLGYSFCYAATSPNSNNLPYNYDSTEYYVIKLSPIDKISTKDNFIEGQIVHFKVCDDVIIKNKQFLQKDEIVNARIETIIPPARGGLPAELTIDNFEIPNTNKSQLISEIIIQGNVKWWLKLIKSPKPSPVSVLPISQLIKGGHAKISPKDAIRIKYFPDWK